MSHSFQTSEGIILNVTPYKEHDLIISFFTPDRGVIKLFYKGARSKKKPNLGMYSPLTLIEAIYQEKQSELFTCRELKFVYSFPKIRQQQKYLEAACEFLQAISLSHLTDKPAPLVYQLLLIYLKRLPEIEEPRTVAMSFYLKVLKHEGLIKFPFHCIECQQQIFSKGYSFQLEWMCELHQHPGCEEWIEEEIYSIYLLGQCQQFKDLELCLHTSEFYEKIRTFFRLSILH